VLACFVQALRLLEIALPFLLGCLLSIVLIASPISHAEDLAVSPIMLVGKWTASEKLANGATLTVALTLTQNMKFSGSMTLQGSPYWDYSGTWEVKGSQVIWHYENTSRPLPESAKTDVDDIVSVDEAKLVVVSHLTRQQHVFERTK
jgi:hypothetical protein